MIQSLKKTVRTAGVPPFPVSIHGAEPALSGVRGLFDGISGTWLRQMSYSMCRFWAYDESKKLIHAGASIVCCGTF